MKFAKHVVVGTINWDTLIFAPELPDAGEEVQIRKMLEVPGGKGANVAIASSRLLGKRNVAIIGALGKDDIGDKQVSILKSEGVITDLIYFVDNNVPSGRAVVVVDSKGKNVILTYKEANNFLDKKTVTSNTAIMEYINNSIIVTITDPPLTVAETILSLALSTSNTKKITTIWAPGLASSKGVEGIRTALKKTGYLILNEPEFKSLTGSYDDDIIAASEVLLKSNEEMTVIITLGEHGCILADKKKVISISTIKMSTIDDHSHSIRILNTAGSGDAFIGTFAAMKILGNPDIEALIYANLSGTIKATRETIRASPTLGELIECKKNNPQIKPRILLEK
jgi:ribokinase